MSNLQDVPLAEPETMPTTEQDTAGTKSNSLKRFFKLGKKTNTCPDFQEDANALEDEARDTVKTRSIGRFLTRLKGATSKSATVQFTQPDEPKPSTVDPATEEAANKPQPNVKPTLKTSISGYWKQLFHRQKSVNRFDQTPSVGQLSQQAAQEVQTDANPIEAVPTAPPPPPLPMAPAAITTAVASPVASPGAGGTAAVAATVAATAAATAVAKAVEAAAPASTPTGAAAPAIPLPAPTAPPVAPRPSSASASANSLRKDKSRTEQAEDTMDNQSNCVPEILEEMQMLAVSQEVVAPFVEAADRKH